MLTLAVHALGAASTAAWERRAPLPDTNGGFFAGLIDSEIVVAGGTNWKNDTKHWLDRIWAYNPERNTWRDAGRLEAPLAYGASGQDARTLWFASGSSGTETHRWLWKLGRGLSPQRVAAIDRAFVYSSGAIIGGRLYVVGGSDDQSRLDRLTRDFFAIDVGSGKITRLPDYPEEAIGIGTAAVGGERFFVFGGARLEPGTGAVVNHSAAHVYSPAAGKWEALSPLPFAVRGITAVALDEHHLYLAGGYRNDTGFTTEAFIFDVRTGKYAAALPLPYAAGVALVKAGDWLYCLGGEDKMKQRTDAVFRIRCADLLTKRRL